MRCIIETQSWIRPQNDPYRLENFQQAYDACGNQVANAGNRKLSGHLMSLQQARGVCEKNSQQLPKRS